jgi:CubicO group peptidase (beta-lactamase class C family)
MTPITAQTLADFDEYIGEQMQVWPGPGLAVSIINKGEVLHKCYGVRSIESLETVNPDTLFSIGSCTKSFTTMALGLLVQQGNLAWDTPIRQYIPDFELADTVASEQMTLRDLASHRSGLPRHDVMWYGSSLSRKELYHRLRYLQPSKPFRYVFQYQNMMYMTAGYLIEQITGLTWEEFVAQNILCPLGMDRSTTDMAVVKNDDNAAQPHSGKTEGINVIPYYALDAVGPAGAIYSSLNDMAKWMLLHMNAGKHNGEQFIDSAILRTMHTAQIIMPPVPEMVWRDYPEISLNMSGLGWASLIYRGHSVVRHMGAIDGFVTQVAFIPAEDIAVIIMSNMNGNLLPAILTFELFDRLLGLDSIDWSGRFVAYMDDVQDRIAAAREQQVKNRQKDCPASHPLADYAGRYENPAYGVIQIEQHGTQLAAARDALEFTLTHYHYDTFVLENEKMEIPTLVTFYLNPAGQISELRVPFEPAVDPIVFERHRENEENTT